MVLFMLNILKDNITQEFCYTHSIKWWRFNFIIGILQFNDTINKSISSKKQSQTKIQNYDGFVI